MRMRSCSPPECGTGWKGTDPAVKVERETEVCNREGLHFRPIMRVVDTVSQFVARVTLHSQDRSADGRSPMELLMLVATCGTRLRVVAEGPDAPAALDAVVRLIESGFEEKSANLDEAG